MLNKGVIRTQWCIAETIATHLAGTITIMTLHLSLLVSVNLHNIMYMLFIQCIFFAGHGIVVWQFRDNEDCGALEELEPIDENRRYDFNYQQVTHLSRKVKILPVSWLGFGLHD